MAQRPRKKQTPAKRVEPHFDDAPGKPKKTAKKSSKNSSVKKTAAARKSKPSKKTATKKTSRRWRILRWLMRPVPRLTYWGVVLGLWAAIAVGAIVAFYAAQLPSAESWAIPERPPNVRIVADDGSLIANRGLTGGKALRLEEMSPHIPQAVIAIEDRRFHSHFGFDPIGFTRAMVRNVMQKKLREGGSTITQQLAKNLFLTPERSFGRKVQELVLAIWLEAKYSKAQILEMYLNRVYFGSGAIGVDAASRRYFGKPARHVTIPEAALLAGLLKAPSRYSPARDPKLAQKRARIVLRAMQEEGFVKPGSINADAVQPGNNARHFRNGPNHYVADMVMDRLKPLIGAVQEDLVVKTTISPYLMTAADAVLQEKLEENGKKRRVDQAALVTLSPEGAIRALVGGRSYARSQYNRVTDAKRQPGSAFKTFVWLAAMERGFSPQSQAQDTPVRYGKWAPKNYDGRYRGAVSLSGAFAQSLNTVAAQLIMEAGPKTVASTAHRLGIRSDLSANASLALGTSEVSLLELTGAYAPFANGGKRVEPYLITRIDTARRSKRKNLFARRKRELKPVVAPEPLRAMNSMLQGVIEHGTGRAAKLDGHRAGGKTGTSQNFRDALFVGHTAHLVTGVWFGNDNNKPTKKLTGGTLPAETWQVFMEAAHRDIKPRSLPGGGDVLADLPALVPQPQFRPPRELAQATAPGRPEQTSPRVSTLRERVDREVAKRAGKSVLDVIFGN